MAKRAEGEGCRGCYFLVDTGHERTCCRMEGPCPKLENDVKFSIEHKSIEEIRADFPFLYEELFGGAKNV